MSPSTVVDLAEPDIAIQELQGTTDATGVASFTEVARPTDPGVALEIQAIAVRDRSSVNPDGCTVTEHLGGSASAAAGLEVTIDVEVIDQQDETTCPPPVEDPPVIVEGTAGRAGWGSSRHRGEPSHPWHRAPSQRP